MIRPFTTTLNQHTNTCFQDIQNDINEIVAWSADCNLVFNVNPAGNYMFKANNRNPRTRCKICLKLTIKTPEQRLASFWCLYC